MNLLLELGAQEQEEFKMLKVLWTGWFSEGLTTGWFGVYIATYPKAKISYLQKGA